MKESKAILIFIAVLASGCAGPNPNVGERTTDRAWLSGNYATAYEVVLPRAEAGEPWAQLRLGIFYENGWGVKRNIPMAIEWYKKAAAQKAEGNWAEGQMIGAVGRIGYFNQNSDARIAQHHLAVIYMRGVGVEKDLMQAYLNIRSVVEETQGKALFFCCEFAGGRGFSAEKISSLYQEIASQMSPKQKSEAEAKFLLLQKGR